MLRSATQQTKHISLDGLPNELLLEIVAHCGDQRLLPQKFTIPYVLSRLNRRLQAFALPLLISRIAALSIDRYRLLLEHYAIHGKHNATFVRHLSIGSDDQLPHNDQAHSILSHPNIFPFSKLQSFEFLGGVLPVDIVQTLSKHAPHLRHLSLVWLDGRGLPKIEDLTELETLRVRLLTNTHWVKRASPSLRSVFSSTLTTLSIHDCDGSDWGPDYWKKLRFPNLRVLNMQCVQGPADQLYQFVDLHTKLLQVNVSFYYVIELRLEALIKLIEGRGLWIDPKTNLKQRDELGITSKEDTLADNQCFPVDNIHVLYRSPNDPMPLKDDLPQSYITFDAFAFTRIPISLPCVDTIESTDKYQSRYRATGLALDIQDQCELEDLGVAYIHDFFSLSDTFPELEELRLSSRTWLDDGIDPTEFIMCIGFRLSHWKHLCKLYLNWVVPPEWEWGTLGPHNEPHPPADSALAFLDSVSPPIEDWNGEPLSINMLKNPKSQRVSRRLMDSLEEYLAKEHPGFDPDDRNLIMSLWGDRHSIKVTALMRRLASFCPTLEQIDLYPMGIDSENPSTRWSFKILRKHPRGCEEGPDHIHVSGHLTWNGCSHGDPWPFEVLIGQELEWGRSSRRSD